jgi:DNA-binding LytR/AlgR family response regulator
MRYSFLIIDNDSSSVAETMGLFEHFPNYKCAGHIKDSENVITEIARLKPQLVIIVLSSSRKDNSLSFSKIEEMHQYMESMPYFIIISKNNSRALEAIQSGISDYLIKPVALHDLGKSLFKFEKKNVPIIPSQICIKSYTDYQFVNIADIIYLKADNNTTDFKLSNGRTINAYKTLKYFENKLPYNFLRIHKSYVVNINYVSRIQFAKLRCVLDYNEAIPFTLTYRVNIDSIVKKIERQF